MYVYESHRSSDVKSTPVTTYYTNHTGEFDFLICQLHFKIFKICIDISILFIAVKTAPHRLFFSNRFLWNRKERKRVEKYVKVENRYGNVKKSLKKR